MPRTAALLLCSISLLSGCRSAFIEATLTNQGSQPVKLVEVDYPSASFGVGMLAPQVPFHYRFKLQGSGEIKLAFTDAAGKVHSAIGPVLHEGQQGKLSIAIDPGQQVHWTF